MIRYEANPPKTAPGADPAAAARAFADRMGTLSGGFGAVHVTENVLGYERLSPLAAGRMIREGLPGMPVTASMRVRDRGEREVAGFVEECVSLGFSGVLVLMGDPSRSGGGGRGMAPSRAVRMLKGQGFDSRIDLYMSMSASPGPAELRRKTEAGPRGFITQVVSGPAQVERLCGLLGGFDVIPIILYPSQKNARAARFLGLDLAGYSAGFEGLVSESRRIAGDVLLTSPADLAGLNGFVDGLS